MEALGFLCLCLAFDTDYHGLGPYDNVNEGL